MAEPEQSWKPLDRQVDYACAVLESTAWLWDEVEKEALVRIGQKKLDALWQVVWLCLPKGHQQLCAGLFWDTVVTQYSRKCIYRVEAVFGETLNPNGDAKRVILRMQPAKCAELVQYNLVAQI